MVAPRRYFPSMAALRAVEALDRLGSASAAAGDLNLTQGAISRQLQSLEAQMGVDLVDRSQKQLRLTDRAGDFAAEIRQALTTIAQATHNLVQEPVAGTLHLAILPAFGMRWLMPRLPDFARLHPDVTINMATRLQPFSFATESFDAALHYGRARDWPHSEGMLLRHEQLLPVCSPDFFAGRNLNGPQDLASCPLLHIQTRPTAWKEWFAAVGVPIDQPLDGAVFDQFATISQAAQHGMGVALMPDYLVEQDVATGRLVALYDRAIETGGAYYLMWARGNNRHPGLTKFRDWLAPQAQAEDPLPR
ncbi:LysR family transcriptional regulator [Epibacterium sp. SM1979]|uniref:LysR family transcriptional regulator n=1 Tax=Tritonibacter litoralis TaxID=2662264 RepID=A0A843Y8C6_9RHOB|nr:LysR family transcriptional regulator [Tritonibacter litoralis]MQQ07126.1 LysR family transcriptional regulator [Tritonibacter litoralis]